jgi:DNA-binding transcriptional MerR regulator
VDRPAPARRERQAARPGRKGLFSVGAAASMIGVSPATLRNWEERYAVVVPSRTETGHRLYSCDQVERLRFIAGEIDRGMSTADAHRLLENRIHAGEIGEQTPAMAASRLLVLVAERDEYSAELIEFRLQAEGFGVSVALDAEEAKETFEHIRPDLTMMEFLIEGGGGDVLCRWLREKSTRPFLVMSTLDAADRALAAGAGAFLRKPVGHRQLISAVEDLLGLGASIEAPVQGRA